MPGSTRPTPRRGRRSRELVRDPPGPRATLADVADHIDHVREVAGIDHVGLGGDYDGITSLPVGLEDVSCYPRLLAALAERGWSERDLGRLTGGNVLRVDARRRVRRRRSPRSAVPSLATMATTSTAADPDGRYAARASRPRLRSTGITPSPNQYASSRCG